MAGPADGPAGGGRRKGEKKRKISRQRSRIIATDSSERRRLALLGTLVRRY